MKKFRLTRAGLLYTLFSLSLLCAGFLCGELLTSICGAGLCLYCLQAVLSLALSAAFLKNARYEAELKNNIITVKALFPGNARKKHPLVIPGIVSFYVFCFTTSGGEKNKNCKTLEIKIRLKKTINEFKIPEYKRGLYFLKSEYIELTDIAGFFSAAFFNGGKSVTEILIPPRIEEDCNFDLPSVFDETAGRLLNVRRTEELYESRPYIPGDDTRKINWKLYAHTEELAVLQGDFAPPPQNFFTLYVQEPVLQKHAAFAEDVFDIFINKIAAFAAALHRSRININFLTYDYKTGLCTCETVFEDDKSGLEKIKKLLALPQIRIFQNPENKINEVHKKIQTFLADTSANKKKHLLYFIMPYPVLKNKNYIPNIAMNKAGVFFYLGPVLKTNKPKNILQSFLFYTKELKKQIKYSESLNAIIIKEKEKLCGRGFYGY